MQSPTIIFDHISKTVTQLSPGPSLDQKLAEVAASQQAAPSTSSGQPKHAD